MTDIIKDAPPIVEKEPESVETIIVIGVDVDDCSDEYDTIADTQRFKDFKAEQCRLGVIESRLYVEVDKIAPTFLQWCIHNEQSDIQHFATYIYDTSETMMHMMSSLTRLYCNITTILVDRPKQDRDVKEQDSKAVILNRVNGYCNKLKELMYKKFIKEHNMEDKSNDHPYWEPPISKSLIIDEIGYDKYTVMDCGIDDVEILEVSPMDDVINRKETARGKYLLRRKIKCGVLRRKFNESLYSILERMC